MTSRIAIASDRASSHKVNTLRAILSCLEIQISHSKENNGSRLQRHDVMASLVSIISYIYNCIESKKLCEDFDLVTKIKYILKLKYLKYDCPVLSKCLQTLLSMYAVGNFCIDHNRRIQEMFAKHNIIHIVIQILTLNSKNSDISRSCMLILHLSCQGDPQKAKMLRKEGGLELIKSAISIHKNRVSSSLVLKPAKLALRTAWFGAKKKH